MACEQEFLFFYIFHQLEGTEHIIVENWLNGCGVTEGACWESSRSFAHFNHTHAHAHAHLHLRKSTTAFFSYY